jgi:NCS1 family nucleobase:cation symporter-1
MSITHACTTNALKSWATDVINLGTWETASSIIQVGLTWRDAIPIMAVGCLCVAIPVVLNGSMGAHLHVPFSVIVRSGFGYYFAYFCIASRCILAMFWLGIQSANGALAMQIMIMAIWPSFASYDWNGPKNTVSDSIVTLIILVILADLRLAF